MKTISVIVLLLLASVFKPVSSSEPTEPTSTSMKTPPLASKPPATTTSMTPPPLALTTQTIPIKTAPADQTTPATMKPGETGATTHATNVTVTAAPTPAPSTPTHQVAETVPVDTVNETAEKPSTNDTVQPSDTSQSETETKGTETPIKELPINIANATEDKTSNEQVPDTSLTGPQSGNKETVKPQTGGADKRLWWIALPALVVAAAVGMVLRFKCKKVADHTDTIDTGTENASFQSRPESTKDGVMLLGVKSSGAEENAAAR